MDHRTTQAPEQRDSHPDASNAALAKFNENATFIGQLLDDLFSEAVGLRKRISILESDLEECREFIERFSDVNDGDYGIPEPNRAMQLCCMIDETLHGRGF